MTLVDILQFSLEPARFLPLDLIPHQKICFTSEECLYLECLLVTCLSLSRDPWVFEFFEICRDHGYVHSRFLWFWISLKTFLHTQSYTSVYSYIHAGLCCHQIYMTHLGLGCCYIPFVLGGTRFLHILSFMCVLVTFLSSS